MTYEYKVIPAPTKGQKAKGLRSTPDRFANALETVMNEQGRAGWDYVRADTLPCEEREGLMGRTTVFQNMLVFRRASTAATAAPVTDAPALAATEKPTTAPRIEPVIAPVASAATAASADGGDDDSSPDTAGDVEQDDSAPDEKSGNAS